MQKEDVINEVHVTDSPQDWGYMALDISKWYTDLPTQVCAYQVPSALIELYPNLST